MLALLFNYFQPADQPEDAPEIILDGFKLLDEVVIPHYDHQEYAPIMKRIEEKLMSASHVTVALTDTQALVIEGNTMIVVGQ